jgi:hypothetical protein
MLSFVPLFHGANDEVTRNSVIRGWRPPAQLLSATDGADCRWRSQQALRIGIHSTQAKLGVAGPRKCPVSIGQGSEVRKDHDFINLVPSNTEGSSDRRSLETSPHWHRHLFASTMTRAELSTASARNLSHTHTQRHGVVMLQISRVLLHRRVGSNSNIRY